MYHLLLELENRIINYIWIQHTIRMVPELHLKGNVKTETLDGGHPKAAHFGIFSNIRHIYEV